MDTSTQDTTTQPISDDQELAKALAGVMPDEPEAPTPPAEEQITMPPLPEMPQAPAAQAPAPTPQAMPTPTAPVAPTMSTAPTSGATDLDDIRSNALDELRGLIDKVELPADEKFDVYLMLIRSTDDTSLIAPAHAAAQGIEDEKKKAEALLEIVKEIDYLSRKKDA